MSFQADAAPGGGPTLRRHELRRRYQQGQLSKHQYGADLREFNRDLEEYCSFIATTNIASITLTGNEVMLESRLAPVRFSCLLDDIGTPPLATLALGSYEPLEMATLLLLLGQARTFFDVGANIGWYSVHAAALFPLLDITAFEPISSSYRQLRHNLDGNGLTVRTEPIGLSDSETTATMHVSPTLSGAASMHPSRSYADQVVETVHFSTLDIMAAGRTSAIDVIKVDVEGAELSVLRGGVTMLEADRPAVFAEMLRLHSRPFGYHPNEILVLMASLGYHCLADRGQRVAAVHRDGRRDSGDQLPLPPPRTSRSGAL